jgi:hypothetical protein
MLLLIKDKIIIIKYIKILYNNIMPKFSNGKITSSVIFYNRGVPNDSKYFAWLASQNFSTIKTIYRYNKIAK